jgi:macrolide transport system ATP-binding/permease protein
MSIDHGSLAHARAQLVATGVHVERGGRAVLTDLTIAVSRGMRLGIVGENGRGKSTLLHVLSGALAADRGEVLRVGSLGVAEQEIVMDADRTVGGLIDVELAQVRAALAAVEETSAALAEGRNGAEDAYAEALEAAVALDAWEADRHVDVALSALGAVTDRTRLLAELSVERYRVRLACLLGAGDGLPAARRADQPPRPPRARVPDGSAAGLRGGGRAGQPRPAPTRRCRHEGAGPRSVE